MSETHPPRLVGAEFTTAIFSRIGVDRYMLGSSALGPVYVGWTARGVSAVRLAVAPDAEVAFTAWYLGRTGRRIVRARELDAVARAAQAKLGDAAADDAPVDLDASTPLERAVLASVAQIRAGYARPYALIARDLDQPCSAQSVAQVLAHNAVPLLIACHRVVPEDRCCGTDYVFGPSAQQLLLQAEGLDVAAVDHAIERGFRYIENDGWFCLPTCGDIALKIDTPGYRPLDSLAQARARGLRACESCRPVAA